MPGMLSEDEFVVLCEHAGILQTLDETGMECVDHIQLAQWLKEDGSDLLLNCEEQEEEGTRLDKSIQNLIQKHWITPLPASSDVKMTSFIVVFYPEQ